MTSKTKPRKHKQPLCHKDIDMLTIVHIYRPQRSWGKVIFSHASVILSTGGRGHAWLPGGVRGCQEWGVGGMHGCWGVCVVAIGGACMVAGGLGHVWLPGGIHDCRGACVVARGRAWLPRGVCMVVGGMHGIRRDTVNERAVRILLECILVPNEVTRRMAVSLHGKNTMSYLREPNWSIFSNASIVLFTVATPSSPN